MCVRGVECCACWYEPFSGSTRHAYLTQHNGQDPKLRKQALQKYLRENPDVEKKMEEAKKIFFGKYKHAPQTDKENKEYHDLMKKYSVPGSSQVTSCAFGGPELDQLYITTASAGIDEAKWAAGQDEESAGHLFRLDLSGEGIKGVPSFSYKR